MQDAYTFSYFLVSIVKYIHCLSCFILYSIINHLLRIEKTFYNVQKERWLEHELIFIKEFICITMQSNDRKRKEVTFLLVLPMMMIRGRFFYFLKNKCRTSSKLYLVYYKNNKYKLMSIKIILIDLLCQFYLFIHVYS
jgi:hypothetical protein